MKSKPAGVVAGQVFAMRHRRWSKLLSSVNLVSELWGLPPAARLPANRRICPAPASPQPRARSRRSGNCLGKLPTRPTTSPPAAANHDDAVDDVDTPVAAHARTPGCVGGADT